MTCATRSGSQSAWTGRGRHAQLEARVVLLQGRLELAGDVARQRREVGGLGAQLDGAGLQPREVEQVGGELAQARDLLADLRQEAIARLVVEVLVLQQLEEPAEGEDRRAQLVRGRGDEALAGRVQLGELQAHAVERAAELSELVGAPEREPRREVAARHPLGALLEVAHAARQRPCAERPELKAMTSATRPAISRRSRTTATESATSRRGAL